MGDTLFDSFMLTCPTMPVIHASEMNFSIEQPQRLWQPSKWPLEGFSCGEITPTQVLRQKFGLAVGGSRFDLTTGGRLRLGRYILAFGSRTTFAGSESPIAPAERQRVGCAEVAAYDRVGLIYCNDHSDLYGVPWPGDGDDKGDTTAFQLRYNLAPHKLSMLGWRFEKVNLTLRLATGIPNRASAVPAVGGKMVYSEVHFREINRGDLNLSTTLGDRYMGRLELGLLVNSDLIRNFFQNTVVHDSSGIPRVPGWDHSSIELYMRFTPGQKKRSAR